MWPFGKNKPALSGDKLIVLFASDLHGSNVCFKKFVNGAKFYGANCLVMGGDLTGKAIMPIARQSDGSYLAHSSAGELRLQSQGELNEYSRRVSDSGFYPSVMAEEEFRALGRDEQARHGLFKRLVCERVTEWCDYASSKLAGTGVRFITAPGNDDFFEIDDILRAAPQIEFHEMEVTEIAGYEMLHCGGSNKTPWDTEREYTEEQYQQRFSELVPKVKNMDRCIFNVHVPPHGSVLDTCPKLDATLQVVYDMGNPVSMHAGSTAVLNAIKQHQPLLGLHGHIHEGRGQITIGKTVCLNPGSAYPEGILQSVLVTLQGGAIRGVQLTQG
jgi:Icc-related predicted phosphoesterase